jgi:hypothetical protein
MIEVDLTIPASGCATLYVGVPEAVCRAVKRACSSRPASRG